MSGHGHVTPNPDGSRARCGGPALCPVCAKEAGALLGGKAAEAKAAPAIHWALMHNRAECGADVSRFGANTAINFAAVTCEACKKTKTEQIVHVPKGVGDDNALCGAELSGWHPLYVLAPQVTCPDCRKKLGETWRERIHFVDLPNSEATACGIRTSKTDTILSGPVRSDRIEDVNCKECLEAVRRRETTLEPRKGRWPVAIASGMGGKLVALANDGSLWWLYETGREPSWERAPDLPQEETP